MTMSLRYEIRRAYCILWIEEGYDNAGGKRDKWVRVEGWNDDWMKR